MKIGVPVYAENIYTDAAILDPYPHYARLRASGPLVYLSAHGIHAVPRYAEAKQALLSHRELSSAHGVAGFEWPAAFAVETSLSSGEPTHSRFRKIIGAPLQPAALASLSGAIEQAADDLVKRLAGAGTFDLMADFARVLPVSIVSSMVGLPERGRERMLDWAAASFDLLGADNARARAAFAEAGAMIDYVQRECSPETVRPDGWTALIWDAVARGEISAREAGVLHIDLLAPSLDTTIFATGHLVNLLATNPDQWARLKAAPELVPAAIEEAVRLESPIRAFARVAKRDVAIGGAVLPAGGRVLIMYASANRDERRWQDPERYSIDRPGLSAHLGFGQGRHGCVGMHLARLEMRALLSAILRRVERIEVGEPVYATNNVLRGFSALPTRFET